MHKFEDLIIGDMFNTMSGRWVKIFDNKAICVNSVITSTAKAVDDSPKIELGNDGIIEKTLLVGEKERKIVRKKERKKERQEKLI
jgi:hypothetical protein